MTEEEQFRWPDRWLDALPAVRRCVRSVGWGRRVSEHDIEDVFQNACLQIHVAAEATRGNTKPIHFDSLGKFCAWAKKVAYHCICREYRKKGRSLPAFADLAPSDPLPENWYEEYVTLVKGEKEQRALRLHLQGEPFPVIADSLGVSQGTAFNLHKRALDQLRGKNIT